MDGMLVNMTDWELINLCFVKINSENDVTWLIGHYVGIIWSKIYMAGEKVSLETFIGYLKFKYREFKISSSLELKHVGALAQ